MIIAEQKAQTAVHDYDKFGEAMPDGRLTAAAKARIYRVRDIVLETRRLGRQLTQEELERFVIEQTECLVEQVFHSARSLERLVGA